MTILLEDITPTVKYNGLNTNKNVVFGGTLSVTGLFTSTGGLSVPTGKTIAATDSAGITANGVIIPAYEFVDYQQAGNTANVYTNTSGNVSLYVNDSVSGTYKVAGVSASFATAASSSTLQVEVATGTQAPGSGTVQLTGTMSLAGTANTTVNGTVIASPTTIAAGNRVNLVFGGTNTALANCVINVVLQRLS